MKNLVSFKKKKDRKKRTIKRRRRRQERERIIFPIFLSFIPLEANISIFPLKIFNESDQFLKRNKNIYTYRRKKIKKKTFDG